MERGISVFMIYLANILILGGLLATVGILFLGLFGMARGGEFNQRWSNRLMRYRILAQAFALAMVALGLFLRQGGA